MTKGYSRLRTDLFQGKQSAMEINKSIQLNYNEAWKVHLCPEILPVSARNLEQVSNGREGFWKSWVYPKKQKQPGQSSSMPRKRWGEKVLERASKGWTLHLWGEELD